jgi:hypothetical protein
MGDFDPIQIPPGVVGGPSSATAKGRWADANMVRWVGGNLRPVMGWDRLVLHSAFASPVRAVHTWVDNLNGTWIGVLCEKKIYVVDVTGNVTDITPVDFTGPQDDVFAGGYGNNQYSKFNYGDPRPDVYSYGVIGPAWTLDNWGQDLLICSSYDGRLLRWTPNVAGGSLAAMVPNSPLPIRTFVVTPERYVMVFGGNSATNFNQFAWCSQEVITDWDYASLTNTAGFYTVQPAAPILTARVTKFGIVMFTATGIFLIQYIGVPYVYSFYQMAGDAIPLADALVVRYSGKLMWLAADGFWTFDGGAITQLACPLINYIRETCDPSYIRIRGVSVNVGMMPEIWVFFPIKDSKENGRYISWNYAENWWSMGQLNRTCGYQSIFTTFPVMSDGTNLYYHERYNSPYSDYNALPYATCTFINTNSGGVLTAISQAIVDQDASEDVVNYTLEGRITTRMDQKVPCEIQSDPPGPLQPRKDGYLDCRITARDIQLTVAQVSNNAKRWSFGQILIKSAKGRGKR